MIFDGTTRLLHAVLGVFNCVTTEAHWFTAASLVPSFTVVSSTSAADPALILFLNPGFSCPAWCLTTLDPSFGFFHVPQLPWILLAPVLLMPNYGVCLVNNPLKLINCFLKAHYIHLTKSNISISATSSSLQEGQFPPCTHFFLRFL